jgi:hypothetical protein
MTAIAHERDAFQDYIERAHPFAQNAKEWGTHLIFSLHSI